MGEFHGGNEQEFNRKDNEYGGMLAALAAHRTKFALAASKALGSAAMKLAVLAAAIAAAVIISSNIHINSILVSVSQTTASINAHLVADREEDKGKTVYYRLQKKGSDGTLDYWFFSDGDADLRFDNLEESTTYVITYYTQMEDADGNLVMEIIGRFEFTTLGRGGGRRNSGKPSGGQQGGGNQDQPRPSASPIIMVTPYVPPTLTILTESLSAGIEESAYREQLRYSYNGVRTVRFSYTGALPQGLAMDQYGTITGTPTVGTATGSPYTITVKAEEIGVNGAALADAVSDTKTLTIEIVAPPDPLEITTTALKQARVGQKYSYEVMTNRASKTGLSFTASGLPNGFDISTSGVIGTDGMDVAASAGNYPVTVRVYEAATGLSDSKDYTLIVKDEPSPAPELDLVIESFYKHNSDDFPLRFDYRINTNGATVYSGSRSYYSYGGNYVANLPTPMPDANGYIEDSLSFDYPAQLDFPAGGTLQITVEYSINGVDKTKTASVGITAYADSFTVLDQGATVTAAPEGGGTVVSCYARLENNDAEGRPLRIRSVMVNATDGVAAGAPIVKVPVYPYSGSFPMELAAGATAGFSATTTMITEANGAHDVTVEFVRYAFKNHGAADTAIYGSMTGAFGGG